MADLVAGSILVKVEEGSVGAEAVVFRSEISKLFSGEALVALADPAAMIDGLLVFLMADLAAGADLVNEVGVVGSLIVVRDLAAGPAERAVVIGLVHIGPGEGPVPRDLSAVLAEVIVRAAPSSGDGPARSLVGGGPVFVNYDSSILATAFRFAWSMMAARISLASFLAAFLVS